MAKALMQWYLIMIVQLSVKLSIKRDPINIAGKLELYKLEAKLKHLR